MSRRETVLSFRNAKSRQNFNNCLRGCSVAIMSDASHMFSDALNYAVAITATTLVGKAATMKYTYGFHRAEAVGSLFSVLLLYGVTALLVLEAIGRLFHPEHIDGRMMIFVALIAVAFNIILLSVLGHDHHHHHHDHIHDHSHHVHGHHHHGHDHHHGNDDHDDHDHAHDHDHEDHSNADHQESGAPLRNEAVHPDSNTCSHGEPLLEIGEVPKTWWSCFFSNNLILNGALLHVAGDLIQSLGVVLAGLVIWCGGML